MKRLLVIDIGGNSVKPAVVTKRRIKNLEKLKSTRDLRPSDVVDFVMRQEPKFDRVVIGYPGVVKDGVIRDDPKNLGPGWRKFDFKSAFGKPTTIMNDAAMQALGSYEGRGRMLFLGLGYGLGTAFVDDWRVIPLECGHLPFMGGKTFEEMVGTVALETLEFQDWENHVRQAVETLKFCLLADSVVLGGGNTKKLKKLPKGCERGDNENAFVGGWRKVAESKARPKS